ncbi:MAG: hypothetical protein QM770_05985 [Tepidisphaeraceae bacterium]
MRFIYVAYDGAGTLTRGDIEAVSAADASAQLRRKGLFATEVDDSAGGTTPATSTGRSGVSTAKRLRLIAMFSRQLQVLLSSGTPLVQALTAVERQADDGAGAALSSPFARRSRKAGRCRKRCERIPACSTSSV